MKHLEAMAIPALNRDGLLPPGVHNATLEEVGQRFGQFGATDRRMRLHAKLEAFAAEARASGVVEALIINGSFTTGKPQPRDIDLIVVLRAPLDLSTDLRPDQYNVLSAKRVKARHGFDVFTATTDPRNLQPLLDFLSQVRGEPGLRKGVVRIVL